MIWEVDDDCDGCVSWLEFQTMYTRCVRGAGCWLPVSPSLSCARARACAVQARSPSLALSLSPSLARAHTRTQCSRAGGCAPGRTHALQHATHGHKGHPTRPVVVCAHTGRLTHSEKSCGNPLHTRIHTRYRTTIAHTCNCQKLPTTTAANCLQGGTTRRAHSLACNTMQHDATPCAAMQQGRDDKTGYELHGLLNVASAQHHATPCAAMQHRATPCTTMQQGERRQDGLRAARPLQRRRVCYERQGGMRVHQPGGGDAGQWFR
jgi:hypothetical protein